VKKLSIIFLSLVAATAFAAAKVVKRGAPLSKAAATPLASVLAEPDHYTKDAVIVEGTIEKACTRKGCWMELVPAGGGDGVRVTFKDYGFFIPLDSKGMKARAEGVTKIDVLSKDDADHLTSEGAKLKRNADGTAREVSFVANGVELTK